MELTTIAVTRKLKKELDKLKVHRKDSYIDVISRLVENTKNSKN